MTEMQVSSPNRALSLSVIGGLLLATSATTAFALTPIRIRPIPQGGLVSLSSQTLHFRDVKSLQMATYELGDDRWSRLPTIADRVETEALQAIDLSSRYDGKRVPI